MVGAHTGLRSHFGRVSPGANGRILGSGLNDSFSRPIGRHGSCNTVTAGNSLTSLRSQERRSRLSCARLFAVHGGARESIATARSAGVPASPTESMPWRGVPPFGDRISDDYVKVR